MVTITFKVDERRRQELTHCEEFGLSLHLLDTGFLEMVITGCYHIPSCLQASPLLIVEDAALLAELSSCCVETEVVSGGEM